MDAPNGLIGQSIAVELCPQQSAALLGLGVELLDVSGGQLVQGICPRAGMMCW